MTSKEFEKFRFWDRAKTIISKLHLYKLDEIDAGWRDNCGRTKMKINHFIWFDFKNEIEGILGASFGAPARR